MHLGAHLVSRVMWVDTEEGSLLHRALSLAQRVYCLRLFVLISAREAMWLFLSYV